MTLFKKASDEGINYPHPDDPGTWIKLRKELSGSQERERDGIVRQTAPGGRMNLKAKDLAAIQTGKGEAVMEMVGGDPDLELDRFDINHYVVAWSVPAVVPSWETISVLEPGIYAWIMDCIDTHRNLYAVKAADLKNSSSSSDTTSAVLQSAPETSVISEENTESPAS